MGGVFVLVLPLDILDLDFIFRRLEPMLPEVVPRLPRPCIEPLVLVPLVVPIEPLVVPIEPLVVPIEPVVLLPLVVPIEPLVVPVVVVPVVVWAKAALLRPSVKRAASKIFVVFMVLRNGNVEKMRCVNERQCRLTEVVFTNCRPSLVTKLLINFA